MEKQKVNKIQELIYELKVSDVMKKNVITLPPHTLMSELRGILCEKRISGIPIVENDNQIIGIISLEDFIEWLAEKGNDVPVSERMTRTVKTLLAGDPLVYAFSQLEKHGYGRYPVVDSITRCLVGIVTKGAIIEGLLRELEIDYHEEEIHHYRASHIFEDIVADSVSLSCRYNVQGRSFNQAGEVASCFKKTLRRLGVHPDIIRRSTVATYEGAMNLVVFTQGGEIAADIAPKKIVIRIEDSGPGIEDLEKAMQPGYSTAPDWVREMGFGAGLGLCNIKKCADKMEIESSPGLGTRLQIHFDLTDS